MNKKFTMSVAMMLGCIVSVYGIDSNHENPLNQMQDISVENVTNRDVAQEAPYQSRGTLYFVPSLDAANQDMLQALISQSSQSGNTAAAQNKPGEKDQSKERKKAIQLKVTSNDFPLLNENGLQVLENEVNIAYKNLNKWQQERLRFYAENGQFDAYVGLIKFWHVIESATYPLSGLFQLVNSVLPLVSIGVEGSTFSLAMKIAICATGVFGLFFSQISQYAGNRISEETAIHDILQVLRRRQDLISLSSTSRPSEPTEANDNGARQSRKLDCSSDGESHYLSIDDQAEPLEQWKKMENDKQRDRHVQKKDASASSFTYEENI